MKKEKKKRRGGEREEKDEEAVRNVENQDWVFFQNNGANFCSSTKVSF